MFPAIAGSWLRSSKGSALDSNSMFPAIAGSLSDALERIHIAGKHAVCAFAEGDELRMMLLGLKRFTKSQPYNTIGMRQELAEIMIQENRYCF